MNWHLENIDDVIQELKSSGKGLSAGEAIARLEAYGPNEIVSGKKRPAWMMFIAQFKDFMILVLIAAALVSGFLGDITDTIVIIAIVVLNAAIGFVQEYRAEKAIEALKKMALTNAVVMRDNITTKVVSTSLVPGDIILLRAGNLVPADIRLSEVVDLKINESALTGESLAVDKQTGALHSARLTLGDYYNIAFKGTSVTNGHGMGIVVATGMKTEFGKIAGLLQEPGVQTPLQKRLAVFARHLAYIIFVICAIVFVAGYLRGQNPVVMLLTTLSLAVAAIPEALPAVVTIALAIGAKKMVKKHALVRKLPAVETLGSVSYICTDKTGTLTLNEMRVEKFAGKGFVGNDFEEKFSANDDYKILMQAIALNNNVHRDEDDNRMGDSTEKALNEFAVSHQFKRNEIEKDFPRVAELPFDSKRKCMTTIHRHNGRYMVIVKGATDVLIKKVEADTDIASWEDTVNNMLNEGLRVIGFATRELDSLPGKLVPSAIEKNLQFIGVAGIIDPPREEAKQAVLQCKTAGIKPVMITGDHPITAGTIAKRLGIIESKEDKIITGLELNEITADELNEMVYHIKVYARVSPEQKLRIVKALQGKGEYVAMTGDGVNDAPALKHADIGVAMGINGTDVSKEAADMILLDDNFATIVKAIKEGRRIYDNIRKFIRYVLTGNTAEILTILIAPFFGLPVPLLPIHILWINLVTDGLPGLALATEQAEKNIMHRPPRKPGENIFSNGLGIHVLWVGSLLAALTISTQAYAVFIKDAHWQTMVFTVLCVGQLFYSLAARSENTTIWKLGLFSNRTLIITFLCNFILQMAIIYLPPLNRLFKTQPLSPGELFICLAVPFLLVVVVEVEKIARNYFRSKANALSIPQSGNGFS